MVQLIVTVMFSIFLFIISLILIFFQLFVQSHSFSLIHIKATFPFAALATQNFAALSLYQIGRGAPTIFFISKPHFLYSTMSKLRKGRETTSSLEQTNKATMLVPSKKQRERFEDFYQTKLLLAPRFGSLNNFHS